MLNQVLPIGLKAKDRASKAIKSESTTDRDANGQQAFGEQKQQADQGPMSEEQLKKALDHLKGLDVVKNNNLQVNLQEAEGKKFVLLVEPGGKVIRRISEQELWSLQIMNEDKRGQLLNRSA